MIKLPELNKDVHRLEEICESFDLQPRGSDGGPSSLFRVSVYTSVLS